MHMMYMLYKYDNFNKKHDKVNLYLKQISNTYIFIVTYDFLYTYIFVDFQFHFEQEKAVFYIQDRKASESLRGLSNRLTMSNGFKVRNFDFNFTFDSQ